MRAQHGTPTEVLLLRDTRRLTLRIYAAMVAWVVAVAALLAGTGGLRGAWWVAFPASVLACVLSALPRGNALDALFGARSADALEALALHMGPLLAADRRRVYAALGALLSEVATGQAAPPQERAWPGLLVAMREAWLDREWRLVAALLRTLGAHGPTSAMADVERYALGPAGGQAEAEVRTAAHECLTMLARRTEMERQASTLLRPASPMPPADTLLRPAGPGVPGGNGATLVRPADEPDGKPGPSTTRVSPTS